MQYFGNLFWVFWVISIQDSSILGIHRYFPHLLCARLGIYLGKFPQLPVWPLPNFHFYFNGINYSLQLPVRLPPYPFYFVFGIKLSLSLYYLIGISLSIPLLPLRLHHYHFWITRSASLFSLLLVRHPSISTTCSASLLLVQHQLPLTTTFLYKILLFFIPLTTSLPLRGRAGRIRPILPQTLPAGLPHHLNCNLQLNFTYNLLLLVSQLYCNLSTSSNCHKTLSSKAARGNVS